MLPGGRWEVRRIDCFAMGVCHAHLLLVGPPDLLLVDFYPRESHLITFRDPSSFLVLYNPSCNDLVARHLRTLASKVRALAVL